MSLRLVFSGNLPGGPRRSSGTAAQRARAGARKGALSPRPRRLHHCGGLSTCPMQQGMARVSGVSGVCPIFGDRVQGS